MKNRIYVFLIVIVCTAITLTGCYIEETSNDKFQLTSIGLIVNDYIGDKSYSDEVNEWLRKSRQDLNIYYKSFEGSGNESINEENIIVASEDREINLIIGIGQEILNIVKKHAPQYPNKRYIVLDVDVETTVSEKNIMAIAFDETQAQFLSGFVASTASKNKVMSVVGGVFDSRVRAQVAAYLTGAAYADINIKAKVDYTGDFVDYTKAINLVNDASNINADIIYTPIGYSTSEVLTHFRNASFKFITEGMNNYSFLKQNGFKNIENILISPFKNMGEVVYNILNKKQYDDQNFGKTKIMNFKDDGVQIIKNDNFNKYLNEEQINKIETATKQLLDGKLLVPDFGNMDQNYYDNMIAKLKP